MFESLPTFFFYLFRQWKDWRTVKNHLHFLLPLLLHWFLLVSWKQEEDQQNKPYWKWYKVCVMDFYLILQVTANFNTDKYVHFPRPRKHCHIACFDQQHSISLISLHLKNWISIFTWKIKWLSKLLLVNFDNQLID